MQVRYGLMLLLCCLSIQAMKKDSEEPKEETVQFFQADMELDTFTQEMMKHEWKNDSLQEKYADEPFVQIVSQVKRELAESESEGIDLSGSEATEFIQQLNSNEELSELRRNAFLYTALMHNAWLQFSMKASHEAFKVLGEKTAFTFPQKDEKESDQDFSTRLMEANKNISADDQEIIQGYKYCQAVTYQGTQIQRNAMHTICPHTRDTYALKDEKGNQISYRTPHKEIEGIEQSSITFTILPKGNE